MEIEKELYQYLGGFYKRLSDNSLRIGKQLSSASLLLSLYQMTSNKASRLLNNSAVDFTAIPSHILKDLKACSLIRLSDDDPQKYVLTARGIWEYEKYNKGFDESMIISFIQNSRNFSTYARNLDDKDKIVLLSMIATRVFSPETAMSLRQKNAEVCWLNIFKAVYDFLLEHNVVKRGSLPLRPQGHENPVEYILRRRNELPKKTNHIYRFVESKRQYYLDLYNGEYLAAAKLKHIFQLIFGEINDYALVNKVFDFCKDIAYNQSKYVSSEFKFVTAAYDDILKEALENCYLG
jgi:hypothetical protein